MNINDRFEQGIEHDPRSEEIFKGIVKIDYEECDDYFCWKWGGDGDNGETLMYQLDEYFERFDETPKRKLEFPSSILDIIENIVTDFEQGKVNKDNTVRAISEAVYGKADESGK